MVLHSQYTLIANYTNTLTGQLHLAGTTITLPKDRCPICGYWFNDGVKEINYCPGCSTRGIEPADLITEFDDYAWCD